MGPLNEARLFRMVRPTLGSASVAPIRAMLAGAKNCFIALRYRLLGRWLAQWRRLPACAGRSEAESARSRAFEKVPVRQRSVATSIHGGAPTSFRWLVGQFSRGDEHFEGPPNQRSCETCPTGLPARLVHGESGGRD